MGYREPGRQTSGCDDLRPGVTNASQSVPEFKCYYGILINIDSMFKNSPMYSKNYENVENPVICFNADFCWINLFLKRFLR